MCVFAATSIRCLVWADFDEKGLVVFASGAWPSGVGLAFQAG
jgi:hypothetical protein